MANKEVNVTVQMSTPSKINIEVLEEPVNAGYVKKNEYIVWTISDSDGWRFTSDQKGKSSGIVIKGSQKKFEDDGADPAFQVHRWKRLKEGKDGDGKPYRYSISVTNAKVGEEDGSVLTWDPSIMNN